MRPVGVAGVAVAEVEPQGAGWLQDAGELAADPRSSRPSRRPTFGAQLVAVAVVANAEVRRAGDDAVNGTVGHSRSRVRTSPRRIVLRGSDGLYFRGALNCTRSGVWVLHIYMSLVLGLVKGGIAPRGAE